MHLPLLAIIPLAMRDAVGFLLRSSGNHNGNAPAALSHANWIVLAADHLTVRAAIEGAILNNDKKKKAMSKIWDKLEHAKENAACRELKRQKGLDRRKGKKDKNKDKEPIRICDPPSSISNDNLVHLQWDFPQTANAVPDMSSLASKMHFHQYDENEDRGFWVWDGTDQGGSCTGIQGHDYTIDSTYTEKNKKDDDVLAALGKSVTLRLRCNALFQNSTESVDGFLSISLSDVGSKVFQNFMKDDSVLKEMEKIGRHI